MCKRKWNDKCFVLCSLCVPKWRALCHNMEERVGSARFFAKANGEEAVGVYVAVSARTLLDGRETEFKRNFKLRRAIRRCSTVYVLRNAFTDIEAFSLYEYACRKGKNVIVEGE